MSFASAETPARVVIDAGPLIALIHARDPDHASAEDGFRQLTFARTRLIAPLSIVFEVYKWLLYEVSAQTARLGLRRMLQSLEVVYAKPGDVEDLAAVLAAMPAWSGTLEDALVAVTGLRLDIPVWTLNYRDLSAFGNLQFWTPSRG